MKNLGPRPPHVGRVPRGMTSSDVLCGGHDRPVANKKGSPQVLKVGAVDDVHACKSDVCPGAAAVVGWAEGGRGRGWVGRWPVWWAGGWGWSGGPRFRTWWNGGRPGGGGGIGRVGGCGVGGRRGLGGVGGRGRGGVGGGSFGGAEGGGEAADGQFVARERGLRCCSSSLSVFGDTVRKVKSR